jgi:hypothetical protein
VIDKDVATVRPLADMRRQLAGVAEELDRIGKEIRRRHSPKTLAEWVAWEREFGPEIRRAEPRSQVELYRSLAKQYGLPYVTVKAAFAGVYAR